MQSSVTRLLLPILILSIPLTLIGCRDSNNDSFIGAVYAMNNAETNNAVTAYGRKADGTLTKIGSTATGGEGTGPNNVASGGGGNTIDPLVSNYALTMSPSNRYVFAVNAGSDEVSVMRVRGDFSLELINTVSSGGTDPIGVAASDRAVFVVNSNEGSGTIQPFSIANNGTLSAVGSPLALSGRPTAASLTPDGNTLIVSLIDTNQLQLFSVSETALALTSTYQYPTPVAGRNVPNPFGIDTYSKNGGQYAVIAEARVFSQDGVQSPQTSSVTTFSVSGGIATPLTTDLRADSDGNDSTGPITSCWVALNESGTIGFTSNTNHNTLSTFSFSADGTASLGNATSYTETGEFSAAGLTDLVVVGNYVYQLLSASGEILVLRGADTTQTLVEVERYADLESQGGNQGIAGF